MLFLHDLWHTFAGQTNRWPNNPMVFESKEALLAFWHKINGVSWENLNVTGNDTLVQSTVEDDFSAVQTVVYTRRYLVMDEYGRKLDPRDWNLPIRPLPDGPVVRRIYNRGSKNHRHRVSGPALWRSAARADFDRAFEIGDSIEQAPGLRKKALMSLYDKNDIYDRRRFRRPTRSWKDATKAERQYMRHKKPGAKAVRHKTTPWGVLAADGFSVAIETLELKYCA